MVEKTTISVGTNPSAIASDGANIWVANTGSNSITKIVAATGAVVGEYPAISPVALAFDGTNIWVVSGGEVIKFSAETGAVIGKYPYNLRMDHQPGQRSIASDGTNIWILNYRHRSVTKLLASTGAVVGEYPTGERPCAIAFDGTNIWVANEYGPSVTKLLASTGAVLGTYPVTESSGDLALDGTNIWVTGTGRGMVTKLLAATGAMVAEFRPAHSLGAIAFDGVHIWLADQNRGTLTQLLATDGEVVGRFHGFSSPSAMIYDGTNIWVANYSGKSVTRVPSAQVPDTSEQFKPRVQTIKGDLKQVSVGWQDQVWGIDSNGRIWRFTGDDHASWPFIQVPISSDVQPAQISVAADGTVLMVAKASSEGTPNVFRYEKGPPEQWIPIPIAAQQVCVVSRENAWGLDLAGSILSYSGKDYASSIKILPGVKFDQISAGADRTHWGLSGGAIFRMDTQPSDTNDYLNTSIAGSLTQISVGSKRRVWGRQPSGRIVRYTGDDNHPWQRVPGVLGHLDQVSVGADGTVWGIRAGTIFRCDGAPVGVRLNMRDFEDVDQVVGEIRLFPYNFVPNGWAACDGSLISITEAYALFSLIRTRYGGDGQKNFALPDLQSKSPLPRSLGTYCIAVVGMYPELS